VILGSDESIRRELADAIAARSFRASPIPALQPSLPVSGQPPPAAHAPSSPGTSASAQHAAAPDAHRPAATDTRTPKNGPDPGTAGMAVNGSLKDIARHAAREAERELIYRTLQHTRWNRREAAEILGISYKALLYKIKEAELDKAS
jgi:two-component system, NtrC family, response regulator AtoC